MYQCTDCGALFKEPKRYRHNHGDSPYHIEEWNGCPRCGGAYEPFKDDDTEDEIQEIERRISW